MHLAQAILADIRKDPRLSPEVDVWEDGYFITYSRLREEAEEKSKHEPTKARRLAAFELMLYIQHRAQREHSYTV